MKRYLKSALLAGIASVGLTAEAAYFVDIQQLGDDVVASGSGSINYQALTSEGFSTVGGPRIQANEARLFLTPLALSPRGSASTTSCHSPRAGFLRVLCVLHASCCRGASTTRSRCPVRALDSFTVSI